MFSAHSRILLVIGGLAVVASLTILVVFIATDAERADIEADGATSARMRTVGDELAAALRDEQESLSDYLLALERSSVAQYAQAVANEQAATAAIEAGSAGTPAIGEALAAVSAASAKWRLDFALPALEAGSTGSSAQREDAGKATVHAHEPVQAATSELISALDAVDTTLGQRTIALNQSRMLATALGVILELFAAAVSIRFVWRYGRRLEGDAARAGVMNRFTEVTTFAIDDEAVALANLEALKLLIKPDGAVTHVLNRSKDRAVPEARFGSAVATILPLNALSSCPAIVRGSVHVTDDAAQPLSVRCPIYPADHGTVACVPLAHGEIVGAIHLYWERPGAFPLEVRATVGRIAEHAALAIANRRMLAALQGQANTDARTGLSNSRAFDRALQEALATRQDDETIAVLMLDLDHFKDVNDRHGHPAGDEALRVFGGVLRSCMRDGDLAARYGGEEFAVLLVGADAERGLAIAERIRDRTETTLITMAPGVTERLTVSIGLAVAPIQSVERVALMRSADEALYDAKQTGRNRVGYLGPAVMPVTPSILETA